MQELGDIEELVIESNVQLIVEGRDQVGFSQALLRHLGIAGAQIHDFGGVSQLRGFLGGFMVSDGFSKVEHIGVIRDAEGSAEDAFRSVQNTLDSVGLSVPTQPEERAGSRPSVSVLILPGDSQSGMLETLLCQSFAETPANGCIDEFLECMGAVSDVSIANPDKARVFAYLAATPRPRHSVGVAAQQGQWDLDHSAFDGVRRFLGELADGARAAGTLGARAR